MYILQELYLSKQQNKYTFTASLSCTEICGKAHQTTSHEQTETANENSVYYIQGDGEQHAQKQDV